MPGVNAYMALRNAEIQRCSIASPNPAVDTVVAVLFVAALVVFGVIVVNLLVWEWIDYKDRRNMRRFRR